MSHLHDRPPDRRRFALPVGADPQDRVLALTGLALVFVLLLTLARGISAALSTVDAEVAAANGGPTVLIRGRALGAGGTPVLQPRPLPPIAPPATTDAANGGSSAEPDAAATTPFTFVAPPRQGGAAVAGRGMAANGSAANPVTATPDPSAIGNEGIEPIGAGPPATGLQARLTQLTAASGGWFGPDSTVVRPEVRPVLDQLASLLQEEPQAQVEISGHTDTNGSPDTNLRLSQDRADAVRDELIRRGVDGDRLVATGYGQSRPRNANDTVAGRASNRRIELTVLED